MSISLGLGIARIAIDDSTRNRDRDILLAVSCLLFMSFFFLLQCVRCLNHASFMTFLYKEPLVPPVGKESSKAQLESLIAQENSPEAKQMQTKDRQEIEMDYSTEEYYFAKAHGFQRVMVSSVWYFTIGFRLLASVIPVSLGLNNSLTFFIASIVLVLILYNNDFIKE